jgi:hypothetical protein
MFLSSGACGMILFGCREPTPKRRSQFGAHLFFCQVGRQIVRGDMHRNHAGQDDAKRAHLFDGELLEESFQPWVGKWAICLMGSSLMVPEAARTECDLDFHGVAEPVSMISWESCQASLWDGQGRQGGPA